MATPSPPAEGPADQTTVIKGPVYGLVQGDHNNVTLIFQNGERRVVPFLAPPLPPHLLIGRETLIEEIKRELQAPDTAGQIALLGLPGSGKTALAVALAHDTAVLERFEDGVLWAGLGQTPDPLAVLSSWGGALGIPPNAVGGSASLSDWAKTVRAAIGMRRMLLVLDDAWSLQAARSLLVGGPGCIHLVTTRIPEVALRFAGDRHHRVPELPLAQGVELLKEMAPDVTKDEPEAACELVRLVGALPLALVLMGNHLKLESYGGQPRRAQVALRRLQDATERLLLEEPQSPIDPHPSVPLEVSLSMLAVIGVSYERLPADARDALHDLTVFPPKPNSFAEDAALAIAGGATGPVDLLIDAGLVEGLAPGRYTMHQTISDYARAQNPTPRSEPRMVEFFASFVPEHASDNEALDLELTNILAAVDIADRTGLPEALVTVIDDMQPFFQRRAMYVVDERHLRRAIDATRKLGDTDAEARLRLALGKTLEKQGRMDEADQSLREALDLARRTGRSEGVVDVLVALGWVAGMRGDSDAASLYLQEARSLVQPVAGDERAPLVLQAIGWLTGLHGQYREAVAYLSQALDLARTVAKPGLITDLLQVLGWMSGMGGNYEQAETMFAECLDLSERAGDRDRIIDAHQGLGWVEGIRARYDLATEHFESGLALAREVGHRERVSFLANLGWIAREQGDVDRAEGLLREGLALASEFGQVEKQSVLLKNLGDIERARGAEETAERLYREALELAQDGRFEERAVDALGSLANVLRARGRHEEAAGVLAEALELARENGNDMVLSGLLNELGDVHLEGGRLTDAEACFQEAKRRADDVNSENLRALSTFGLARCAHARGDVAEALRLAHLSSEMFAGIRNRHAAVVDGWIADTSSVDAAKRS
ncbi:MAG: tetratricopeptide repeat protein [Actinomycetota bacterium]|nr:tetratricopeptide repeat protein [Actinomycetota bacterium]